MRGWVLVLLCFGLNLCLKAQEAVFSRMSNTNLYLNPAYAGYETSTSFNFNHKLQWKALGLPYSLSYASMIKPFFKDKVADIPFGGIGLSFIQEKFEEAGYNALSMNVSGAYNLIQFSYEHSLQLGLQAGFTQRRLDPSTLQWGSQFEKFNGYDATFPADPIQTDIAIRKLYPEISSGVVYSYNAHRQDIRTREMDLAVGYAVYHLNRADQSFFSGVKSPAKYSHKSFLYLNKSFPNLYLAPGIISYVQGDRFYFQSGSDLRYLFPLNTQLLVPDQIMVGCWYQNNGFMSYMLGIKNDNYTIGFDYDMVLGKKKEVFGNVAGWEIFLRIEKKRIQVYDYHPPAVR